MCFDFQELLGHLLLDLKSARPIKKGDTLADLLAQAQQTPFFKAHSLGAGMSLFLGLHLESAPESEDEEGHMEEDSDGQEAEDIDLRLPEPSGRADQAAERCGGAFRAEQTRAGGRPAPDRDHAADEDQQGDAGGHRAQEEEEDERAACGERKMKAKLKDAKDAYMAGRFKRMKSCAEFYKVSATTLGRIVNDPSYQYKGRGRYSSVLSQSEELRIKRFIDDRAEMGLGISIKQVKFLILQ